MTTLLYIITVQSSITYSIKNSSIWIKIIKVIRMELDRRLQLELKRKLFASRENNSKIEKTFVNDLGNQFQGQSPVAVQGGNV